MGVVLVAANHKTTIKHIINTNKFTNHINIIAIMKKTYVYKISNVLEIHILLDSWSIPLLIANDDDLSDYYSVWTIGILCFYFQIFNFYKEKKYREQ